MIFLPDVATMGLTVAVSTVGLTTVATTGHTALAAALAAVCATVVGVATTCDQTTTGLPQL
jgi:hypothetical protein